MNTLKGWITTTFLVATLVSMNMTVNAGTGTIIGGRGTTEVPCTVKGETKNDLGGTIIGGLGVAGTIIGGLIGIIVGTEPVVDCGTIIGG